MVYSYYPLLLIVLSCSAFYGALRKRNGVFLMASLLSLSLFLGLRGGDAGVDTVNYISAYNAISDQVSSYQDLSTTFVVNNITAAEPGFVLFTYANKLFGLSSDFYLVSVVFFGLLIVYSAYSRLTNYPLLAFSLYAFSMSCVALHGNVIRQGMAVGFILLAISYIVKGRNKLAISFFLFASLFHFSALLVAIFSIPAMLKLKMRYFWLALISIVVCLLAGIFSKVIFFILPGLFAAKVAKYFQAGFDSLLTFKFISFFIFVAGIEFLRKFNENKIELEAIYRCYFSLFLIQLLFIGDLVASERFGLFRFALEPVIITYFFNSLKEKHLSRIALVSLAFLYGIIVYNVPTIKAMLT